jgi:hypothetical protein
MRGEVYPLLFLNYPFRLGGGGGKFTAPKPADFLQVRIYSKCERCGANVEE